MAKTQKDATISVLLRVCNSVTTNPDFRDKDAQILHDWVSAFGPERWESIQDYDGEEKRRLAPHLRRVSELLKINIQLQERADTKKERYIMLMKFRKTISDVSQKYPIGSTLWKVYQTIDFMCFYHIVHTFVAEPLSHALYTLSDREVEGGVRLLEAIPPLLHTILRNTRDVAIGQWSFDSYGFTHPLYPRLMYCILGMSFAGYLITLRNTRRFEKGDDVMFTKTIPGIIVGENGDNYSVEYIDPMSGVQITRDIPRRKVTIVNIRNAMVNVVVQMQGKITYVKGDNYGIEYTTYSGYSEVEERSIAEIGNRKGDRYDLWTRFVFGILMFIVANRTHASIFVTAISILYYVIVTTKNLSYITSGILDFLLQWTIPGEWKDTLAQAHVLGPIIPDEWKDTLVQVRVLLRTDNKWLAVSSAVGGGVIERLSQLAAPIASICDVPVGIARQLASSPALGALFPYIPLFIVALILAFLVHRYIGPPPAEPMVFRPKRSKDDQKKILASMEAMLSR